MKAPLEQSRTTQLDCSLNSPPPRQRAPFQAAVRRACNKFFAASQLAGASLWELTWTGSGPTRAAATRRRLAPAAPTWLAAHPPWPALMEAAPRKHGAKLSSR